MIRKTVIALALLGLASGCFVADELDSGQAIMDKNSPRGARAKAEAEAPRKAGAKDGDASGSIAETGREALASVEGWWNDLGKPEPDPNDEIVRCRVAGTIQYTLESNCRSRGGSPEGS